MHKSILYVKLYVIKKKKKIVKTSACVGHLGPPHKPKKMAVCFSVVDSAGRKSLATLYRSYV